jgi:hypothetical protein
MAKYVWREATCDTCGKVDSIMIRTDEPEPILCFDCKPRTRIESAPLIRTGAPAVSKISGFGKSFDDFDRDYDRMRREGV